MKYLYSILGTLLLLAGGIYLAGYMLPVEHKVMQTRSYQIPLDSVWQRITNPAQYPDWRPSVSSVEVHSDSGEVLRWTERYKGGDQLGFRETDRIDHTAFTTEIVGENLPFGGTWTITLEEVDSTQTRISISEHGKIYSPVFRFFSRYVFGYSGSINQYFEDLQNTI